MACAFVVYALWAQTPPSASAMTPLSRTQVSVIDGDTIRVAGENARVRLVGFNAPETAEPMCQTEASLGRRATARLRQLVTSGQPLAFGRVACSCRPGTEGTADCNYGRLCGTITVGGRDVGSTLISEGLAVSYHCSRTSCPPLPRPWC
jgi:endonuclease YncB( thermonuclease family)